MYDWINSFWEEINECRKWDALGHQALCIHLCSIVLSKWLHHYAPSHETKRYNIALSAHCEFLSMNNVALHWSFYNAGTSSSGSFSYYSRCVSVIMTISGWEPTREITKWIVCLVNVIQYSSFVLSEWNENDINGVHGLCIYRLVGYCVTTLSYMWEWRQKKETLN